MVKKITGEEFMRETTGTVLVDFYADWCGPRRMVEPDCGRIGERQCRHGIQKVNVDEEPDLAMRYNVRSIPTLILFKDGKEVGQGHRFPAPKQRLQTWFSLTPINKHFPAGMLFFISGYFSCTNQRNFVIIYTREK